MAGPRLKTVTRTQGNNQALKDGTVQPKTFEFDFEEVDPIIAAFRRMVRGNEFDVCEMAITTYICAKAHGKPMTAIPVFIVRAFHHGAILVNAKAGISRPKDLEGKRVGVNRGYTVTTGVWARGILQDEHGVDLSKITWVLSGDEHVAEYKPPANVVPIEPGKKMEDMLASGELAAAIGVDVKSPDVKPLIPNALDAGLAALRQRGHLPDQPHGRDQGRTAARRIPGSPPTSSTPSRARSACISIASRAGRSRSRPRSTRSTAGSWRSPAIRCRMASAPTAKFWRN